jgi:hypothetical protein
MSPSSVWSNQIGCKLGVRLVWTLEPRARSAALFPADGLPVFMLCDGVLDGGDVLPGFRLPLADLFG